MLAEDETDLLLFAPLRAAWAKRGEPTPVLLSGKNARRVVFGAMDLRTGSRLFRACERQRSLDFQVLLEAVRKRYGTRPVVLLLDEDSSHTAQASVQRAQELDIGLLWLPKRAPELNPMDRLWGHAKDLVSANRQHKSIDEQVDWFIDFLQALSDQEVLTMTGVRSKTFWLKSALSNYF